MQINSESILKNTVIFWMGVISRCNNYSLIIRLKKIENSCDIKWIGSLLNSQKQHNEHEYLSKKKWESKLPKPRGVILG